MVKELFIGMAPGSVSQNAGYVAEKGWNAIYVGEEPPPPPPSGKFPWLWVGIGSAVAVAIRTHQIMKREKHS